MAKPLLRWGSQMRRPSGVADPRIGRKAALAARVVELANSCHSPAGSPAGGRFCSKVGGAGTPGGAKAGLIVGTPGTQLSAAKPTAAGTSYKTGDVTRLGYDTIPDDAIGDKIGKKGTVDLGVVNRIASIPGFEDFADRTDRGVLEEIAQRQSENIEDAFDIAMEIDGGTGTAVAHSDWYPYVNRWAHDMSDATGHPPEAIMAATAALSPGAQWPNNVAWAEQLAHIIKNEKNITIPKEWVAAKEVAAWASHEAKIKKHEKANAKLIADGQEPKPFTIKPPAKGKWAYLAGKQLSELNGEEAAVAIRGAHELYGKMVHQKGGAAGLGNPNNIATPQTTPNFTKAINILRNPTAEVIDKNLGGSHKVRSFFQNMRDPFNVSEADVTVDSHHIGLAVGLPLTGVHPIMKRIYDTPKRLSTGLVGTYPLTVEGTRLATARINKKHGTNYTPAQVQSITWEAQRALYDKKSNNLTARIGAIRSAYRRPGSNMSKTEMLAAVELARIEERTSTGAKNITYEEIRAQFVAELGKGR